MLLGAVLLYAMNALLASTISPSAVREFDAIALITWPTAAFFASSIAAASGAGLLMSRLGARPAFIIAATVFCIGALLCAFAGNMQLFIIGRFIQGAGGGLLSALAYALIQSSFPQNLWPQTFALFSGAWGMAVLLGPLIGGMFANSGSWRGAFYFVAGAAALLSVAAATVLKASIQSDSRKVSFPAVRLGLVGASICILSAAQIVANAWTMLLLILLSLATIALMLRLDRGARVALFPSDAFSWQGVVGPGLWMTLLLAAANDPFAVYGPLFLQELHGLAPLGAGYLVAVEALSWTLAALLVSGWPPRAASALIVAGPLIMGAGLAGIAAFMPRGTIAQLIVPIVLAGAGIGSCWAFMSQRVMAAARPGQSDIAATAIPTVQLFGLGFGSAVAGLVANLAGYSAGLNAANSRSAAFWVPASFVIVALAASGAGFRMLSDAMPSAD